jgi:hypothetical protein
VRPCVVFNLFFKYEIPRIVVHLMRLSLVLCVRCVVCEWCVAAGQPTHSVLHTHSLCSTLTLSFSLSHTHTHTQPPLAGAPRHE